MESTTVFNYVLVGILAGVAAFALSVALAVWRRRNHGDSVRGPRTWWSRYGWTVAASGVTCMVLTIIHRELPDRQGALRSKNIFTVRAHDELELDYLTEAQEVSADELLARFSSPKQTARLEELQLRTRMLDAEHQALANKPLELDPELVRRDGRLASDIHQYRASKDQLLPARDQLLGEELRQRLDLEKETRNIDRELAGLGTEEDKIEARCRYLEAVCKRLEKAAAQNVATDGEVEEKQLELTSARADLQQLRRRRTDLQTEKERRAAGLQHLSDMVADQAETLGGELGEILEMSQQTALERDRLENRLAADQERARQKRQQELTCIQLQTAQCRADLRALDQVLNVRSPFAGRVVFRETSPKTAYKQAPLIVVAPGEGLLLKCRLPAGEVEALSEAGRVTFELEEPSVQRRFTGYYVGHEALASEPRYVAALLAVQPPEDCIRDLTTEEEEVLARLKWRPSLLTYPLFLSGLVVTVLWGTGSLIAASTALGRRIRGRNGDQSPETTDSDRWRTPDFESKPERAPVTVGEVPFQSHLGQGSEIETALGASGVVLGHLASNFREAVISGSLDPSLIGAVEWAFDRHHSRAITVFRRELAQDADELAQAIQQFVEKGGNGHNGDPSPDHRQAARMRARMVRIYRSVFPEWRADDSEAGSSMRQYFERMVALARRGHDRWPRHSSNRSRSSVRARLTLPAGGEFRAGDNEWV